MRIAVIICIIAIVLSSQVFGSNETSLNMVLVEGGSFMMGSNTQSDEQPVHSVTLNDFYIGKFEVTQSEWKNPNASIRSGSGTQYPIESISWYAILKYCNIRSMAEGLVPCYAISGSTDPADWGAVPPSQSPEYPHESLNNRVWDSVICNWNANGYRLPTEAEWEYAARGGNKSNGYLYSGSNNCEEVAWNDRVRFTNPSSVGEKQANELGLYDMSGNVCELCQDWYHSDYSVAPSNGDAWESPAGSDRVVRGGGWSNYGYGCRSADRNDVIPSWAGNTFGFRLSRSAEPDLAVTSLAINNGAASTASRTVTLNNACTGSPTQYMAWESSSFSGATWQTYSTAPSFTLSSGNGTKTVYFKVKNASGESNSASDTISLN